MSSTRGTSDDRPNAAVPARPAKRDYVLAFAACALTTAVAVPLAQYFDPANIVMLFLLAVLLVAVRLGRGPAVLAAFLSVGMFDFFLVPPRWSFSVNDAQYLLTFAVMLIVALLTGHLAAGLKTQAELASIRERRTRALYETARELAGALTIAQVAEISRRFLSDSVRADAVLLLPDSGDELGVAAGAGAPAADLRLARLAYQGTVCADVDAPQPVGYFPLKAPARVRGVLAIAFSTGGAAQLHEHHELLETVGSLTAVALERLHYAEAASQAQMQVVSERLRSSILSALSHDVRTPLTALVGLADSLALAKPVLPQAQRESAEAIRDQALQLSGMVGNLLDMARLNAGGVKFRKEWQPLEEVVGSSIKLLGKALARHVVSVRLPADLPLLEFDAVLIERVLCNLLENAAKYSPPGTSIVVSARQLGGLVEISVCDRGPGIAPGQDADIFAMFVRGRRESAQPGVGLGLAICRAIVEAHGGSIVAAGAAGGGACFSFTLPVGTPPTVEDEELAPDVARG